MGVVKKGRGRPFLVPKVVHSPFTFIFPKYIFLPNSHPTKIAESKKFPLISLKMGVVKGRGSSVLPAYTKECLLRIPMGYLWSKS